MRASTQRHILQVLNSDPRRPQSRLGRLARAMLDYDIPISAVADFVDADQIVVRRWLYSVSRTNRCSRHVGCGDQSKRAGREQRIDRLLSILSRLSHTVAEGRAWNELLPHYDAILP